MLNEDLIRSGAAAPSPEPLNTGKFLVGAQVCNLWRRESSWDPIKRFPERKPLLGWYKEAEPEVTDWEIKLALDHGIQFFMACWYRAKSNLGQTPIEPVLDHWLTGLPQSKYAEQFKFMIMWENVNDVASGAASAEDLLDNLLPYWMDHFFSKSNYLVLQGKPVFSIYGVEKFVSDMGGEEQAAQVLAQMRKVLQQAGFAGLTVWGHHCWGSPYAKHEKMQRIGIDYSFAYHWPTFAEGALPETPEQPTAEDIIAGHEVCWQGQAEGAVPNILTCSMGWDSAPWGFSCTRKQWKLHPEQFKTLCQRAKQTMEVRQTDGLEGHVMLIDNWNEYGEGHYIFPTEEHGLGYLQAIRDVFELK